VRAARVVPGAEAASSFIAWGHSQGGHAVMWTGQIARRYAPELQMRGIAAAAPASDLARLFDRDSNEFTGKVLTAMTLWSWSQVFGYPTSKLVDPEAVASYQTVAQGCSESIISSIPGLLAEKALQRDFPLLNPTTVEPWRTQIRRNTPSAASLNIPVLMVQGLADNVVWPQITEDYVRRLCRSGNAVHLALMPDVNHNQIAKEAAPMAVEWMTGRFAGAPLQNNCKSLPPSTPQAAPKRPA
jgi:pimeloyl-ACP methyl ester carboxylesterase